MTTPDNELILYGVPFSQPVRAVMWLMVLKDMPFKMVPINPGSTGGSGSRNPAFLAKNPGGTIPCIEEPDSGFVLAEAHAIMCYLSRKNGWTDVYPEDDKLRARIDWYLHFHHRTIRDASTAMVAPKVRKDLNIPEVILASAAANLEKGLEALNESWLAKSRFLAGETVSLADLAAYAEIGQLQPQFTNTYDFSSLTNIQRWLNDMTQVDGHDEVHVALRELGDINTEPPSMETIINANKLGLETMQQRYQRMKA